MGFGRNYESDLKKHVEEVFGDRLSAHELWAIVKLVKHGRRFCRSNAALNPCLQRIFPYARFQQVPKTDRMGRTYQGLQITVRGEVKTDEEDSEE